ncbi:MAG TPA: type II toxin-antitoxin system VapC family toxin [Candidatus Methanoperedenaceae archaeon]|nr:type II toxin-antitoxin system VapC family toxin [Candidatus Methanoperedenaceae archaeon]
MYCIDASVLTNSEIEGERFHEYSQRFMEIIREREIAIVVPEIVLPEISSAISRGTDNTEKAVEFVKVLRQIPNIVFVPIDRELADEASRLAAEYRIRGCDAIYVAAASMFGAKLISLDKQQIEKAGKCIEVATPAEELENLRT